MLTLKLLDSSSNNEESALYCGREGHCYAKTCNRIFGCHNIEYKFKIERNDEKKNPNIRVGDMVAFRSHYKRNRWLECSDGECRISECLTNQAERLNASEPSDCPEHYFEVISAVKAKGRVIRYNDVVMLKSPHNNTYLICQGRNCKMLRMLPYGACPSEMSGSGSDAGSSSAMQWCCPQAFLFANM